LLMLVACDSPHRAMLTSSDDQGVTWTEPKPLHLDEQGKPDAGLATGLAYLGNGKLMTTDGARRWLSLDYGATWSTPAALAPMPNGKAWNIWDPLLVERDQTTNAVTCLAETGYAVLAAPDSGPGYQQGYIRFSTDEGSTWSDAIRVPQWNAVSEVAILRAANGDWVAAGRTDTPAQLKGETLDHYEGLGVSISKDRGKTWSNVVKLYDWGRHHPSMVLLPNRDIAMTYVVRKGYVNTADGYPQFGVEAVVSHDNGQTWDLDHRYLLHTWVGNRKRTSVNENQPGPQAWWASSQATSSVLLPDGAIITAFGTGYRSQPGPNNQATPRDVGLVLWRLGDQPVNGDRTLRDAPFDSTLRNVFDPVLMKP
jgi:hypothetical protein